MSLSVTVVQHAEKEQSPGDPGLTELGRWHAVDTGRWIGEHEQPVAVWSSPMRRAQQTAVAIAQAAGLEVLLDGRLRERMNWEGPELQSLDKFLDEWQKAGADRSFRSRLGDSSNDAARRFLEFLDELPGRYSEDAIVVAVAHGGVTVDLVRTVAGDDAVRSMAPAVIEDGLPPCGLTRLERRDGSWRVSEIGSTLHLSASPLTVPTAEPALTLRELTAADIPEYFELLDANREHLAPWGYEWEQTATLDEVRTSLHEAPAGPSRLGLRLGLRLVGRIDLVPVDPPRYSVGYWLGADWVGRGLMTAAGRAVIDHARGLGATEVYAGVTHGNSRSLAVLRRLGFEHIEDVPTHSRWWLPLTPPAGPPVLAEQIIG